MQYESRQLAAIMFTDIVGYTALMGENEVLAFEILERNRIIHQDLVPGYGGKILKEMGDGMLISFATASEAVYCAGAILQATESHPQLKIRLGIHLGEVLFKGNDVFGDGVNIASRLEAKAHPGSIYVSEAIYKNVLNKTGIKANYIGEEHLKNVREPVKIFELEVEKQKIPKGSSKGKNVPYVGPERKKRNIAAIVIITFLLSALAYVVFTFVIQNDRSGKQVHESEAVEKSIAVLPFTNLSADPDQEYFVVGLSEEILNRLAQLEKLLVVGRTSSFLYKGEDLDLREIGRTLGVNYILEGSVRRQGNHVRITAQLIRAHDGYNIWSQSYDRTMEDIFEIQDDIAENVAQALQVVLDASSREEMRAIGVRNVEAFIAYQKGYELYDEAHSGRVSMLGTLAKANEEFERAIQLFPGFGTAYFVKSDYFAHRILAADSYMARDSAVQYYLQTLEGAYDNIPDPQRKAMIDFDRTIFSDNWKFLKDKIQKVIYEAGCAEPIWFEIAAIFGYEKGTYDVYRRAWECHPMSTLYSHRAAFTALWAGKPEEAIAITDTSIERLGNSSWFSAIKARSSIVLGDFESARVEASKVPLTDGTFGSSAVLVEAAAGNQKEAKRLAEAWLMAHDSREDYNLYISVALGDRQRANQVAAQIDKLPGGAGQLASMVTTCQCGAPFDLEATPNFKMQLEESGLPWPPESPLKFPEKGW